MELLRDSRNQGSCILFQQKRW